MGVETKQCRKCSEVKELTEFHIDRHFASGRKSQCKTCQHKKIGEWRRANKERHAATRLKSYYKYHERAKQKHKERYRAYVWEWRLKRDYGITAEDYYAIMARQKNRCAICRTKCFLLTGPVMDRFRVDHDHATGKIRGLLCNRCNSGLGMFRDSVKTIRAAVKYLRNHKGKMDAEVQRNVCPLSVSAG